MSKEMICKLGHTIPLSSPICDDRCSDYHLRRGKCINLIPYIPEQEYECTLGYVCSDRDRNDCAVRNRSRKSDTDECEFRQPKKPACIAKTDAEKGEYVELQAITKPTCPEKVCKFCGKPDIDWDEDCDSEGFHEAADLQPETCPECGYEDKRRRILVEKINLHNTIDARVWATEFLKVIDGKQDFIDEGFMIGWFANAIMTGVDSVKPPADLQPAEPELTLDTLREACSKMLVVDDSPFSNWLEAHDAEVRRDAVKEFAEKVCNILVEEIVFCDFNDLVNVQAHIRAMAGKE